ncbi:hypothetical protein D3C76_327340 [compost metagenome]
MGVAQLTVIQAQTERGDFFIHGDGREFEINPCLSGTGREKYVTDQLCPLELREGRSLHAVI